VGWRFIDPGAQSAHDNFVRRAAGVSKPARSAGAAGRPSSVRQASWRDPAGGRPAQVRGSARLLASVA
jgi:hypothetical protein